jgi:hypothetical protein
VLTKRILDDLGNAQLGHADSFSRPARYPAVRPGRQRRRAERGYAVGNVTNACRASVERLEAMTPESESV